ncbi:tryptophan-rich sensory protein [Isobaculum melis]|uniref:TspO/MBR family protein n=1 Tax=Isobaculum melis TaxID=142588 RepID=A0A1H9Q5C7_9LACT|nr:tryptophan-rich sensory protein [Isobaculum melis]SER55766.1 TspO/MBR family protein [Isobaculum melis]
MSKQENLMSKWLVTIIYVIMLGTNAAAILIPLNGMTTQEVSDTYPNLFAPAGLTFAIWSVIYLLLAGFVIYQWLRPKRPSIMSEPSLSKKIRGLFIVSSILNSVWLFAWQYLQINLSVVIMLGLLMILISLNRLLAKVALTTKDRFFVRLPFSIYFGWITIATIANITAFFVDKQIDFFQNNQPIWTVIVLMIGLVIICATILSNHNIAYGCATIWAYYGILFKHQAQNGWNQAYPMIILTVIGCIAVIVLVCIYESIQEFKRKKNV